MQLEINATIDVASELLGCYMEAGDSTMLWGPPGVGKTEVAHQVSKAQGRKVIDIRTNLREPVDFRGIPVPDHKLGTTRWFIPDELPRLDRDGSKGTLLLDEINTASPQTMAVCFQLTTERRIGDYVLPDGWAIVATGNRVKDRAAAQRMPSALKNRLAHIDVTVDIEAWAKWANANKIAPEMIAFVRFRGKDLHLGEVPMGDENAFPTPRSITKAAKYTTAPAHLRPRLFAGLIGTAAAAELEGFLGLWRSLGSLDDILANPKTAAIPTEASLRYAVTVGLARIATRKLMPNLITYAARLPREFEVLAVTDAAKRDKNLTETSAFGAWVTRPENQHITLQ